MPEHSKLEYLSAWPAGTSRYKDGIKGDKGDLGKRGRKGPQGVMRQPGRSGKHEIMGPPGMRGEKELKVILMHLMFQG